MTNLNYHCPICQTKHSVILGQLKYILFNDSPLPNKIDVVSCPNCGFIRYNPLSPQTNYDQFKNTNIFDSGSNYKYSHVLEHIVDLESTLYKLKRKLKRNEKIYIEVPDAYCYQNENRNPLRYFYISHINHFDIFHLKNLFFSNNFEEVESGNCIHKEGNLKIPSIWGIYSRVDSKTDEKISISHNFSLANKIRSWFNDNNINNLDNDNILTDLASSDKVIYIWGIGIHTQMMLGMSPLKECLHRIYFIDSDKIVQKKTIANKFIHNTDILKNATKQDVVVIGAPKHIKEIYHQLIKQYQFKGEVITIDNNRIWRCQY